MQRAVAALVAMSSCTASYDEPVAPPPTGKCLISAKPQKRSLPFAMAALCSQMTASQETTRFLPNCPGMKMDIAT
jgi:hypothetical protein